MTRPADEAGRVVFRCCCWAARVGKNNMVVHGLLIPSLFWPPTYLSPSPSFTRLLRRLYIFRTWSPTVAVPAALLRSSSFDLPSLSSQPTPSPVGSLAPLAPCQRSARTDVLVTGSIPHKTGQLVERRLYFSERFLTESDKLLHSNTEAVVLGKTDLCLRYS